jgi:hypothetical protein
MNTSKQFINRSLGAMAVLVFLGFSSVTSAQLMGISVNFQGSGQALSSTDLAGIVPLDNWNNCTTTSSWTNLNFLDLTDSSGADIATVFSVNYGFSSAGGGQANYGNDTAGDRLMLGGSMVFTSGATIRLTNIPYAAYDLYVYVGPGESGKIGASFNGSVAVGDTIFYYKNLINSAYVLSTDTVGPAIDSSSANYVKFGNLTGASLNIVLAAYNYNNSGIYGFQIIAVPEPSVCVLLVIGGLLLAGCRFHVKRKV